MKKPFCKYRYGLLALAFTFALLTLPAKVMAEEPQNSKTLLNLQTAYNGESNAHVRYLAFAQKADQEGYGQVASLFRAAARAEQIHLTNHAAVIRLMGAEPVAEINPPVVKSTRENLETAANKGEAYERDTMYPEFIEQANVEGNRDAVRTFDLARKAEAQHFNLFTQAVANLESMRGIGHTYYVCTVCGYTVSEPVTGNCVSCGSPAEKYEAVT
ncbi:MAG TPA: ferritin family protein [Terriglobia bacterium]|nr:ferritin family protein [Terriglobia bacterium]